MIEKLIVNPTKKLIKKLTKKSTVYKASVEKRSGSTKNTMAIQGAQVACN
jgi:hypothetical protein